MIDRYTRKPMRDLWSEANKFQAYLDVELLNAEFLFEQGIVSAKELDLLKSNSKVDLQRILELENETKHDVIAFTRAVSETLGEEKRFIHYGLTSTDIVDTANAVLLKKANEIILRDIEDFLAILKDKAYLYKNTYCIGRTHGIHADITVFGLKWALWYDEMQRNLNRFKNARNDIEIGKISGAVGNYAFTNPEAETYICEKLGLNKPNISTQILQRDRHAHYISVLAIVAASLEKIATEIRHLQRTEVGEVQEAVSAMQKGSSAMPHKRNPISSENICGLARIMRSYITPAYENIALWHERDISHSSVERIILPDATSLLDYMLTRYSKTLKTLVVNEKRMQKNIDLTKGVIFSQRIMTALIDKGASREIAYDIIQPLADMAVQEETHFKILLEDNQTIKRYLTNKEIDDLFKPEIYSKNADYIYGRVFSVT